MPCSAAMVEFEAAATARHRSCKSSIQMLVDESLRHNDIHHHRCQTPRVRHSEIMAVS